MKWTPKNLAIAAAVLVVGAWYVKKKAGEVVETVDKNLNPTRDTNLANRAAEWLWDGGSDGKGTPGTDLADWMDDPDRWWNE